MVYFFCVNSKNYKPVLYSLPVIIVILIGFVIRTNSNQIILSTDHTMISDQLFMGAKLKQMEITSYSIITFVKFILVSLNFSIFIICFDIKYFLEICRRYNKVMIFFVVFATVEIISNNFISSTLIRDIVLFLFRATGSSTVQVPYYRAGLYSILLTAREPSLAVYELFFAVIILSINAIQKNVFIINSCCICLACLIMIASLSLTGILFVFTLLLILFVKNFFIEKITKKKMVLLSVLVISLCVVVVIIPYDVKKYYLDRANNAIYFVKYVFENPNSNEIFTNFGGSEIFRIYSIINNIQCFAQSPWFGVGIGTCTAFSGVAMLLSNIGIFGILSYLFYFLKTFRLIKIKHIKTTMFFIFFINLLQGGIVELMCCFYLVIIFIGISYILNCEDEVCYYAD